MNIARFDLISIRLVVACARHGSLTAAARQTHLALAAASRRVHELEDTLGHLLFERHARGLTPTAAGRVFVKHGLTLLRTLDQLGAELTDQQQGIERHLRLCASSAAITQFLPPMLLEYAVMRPKVRIDLEEQVSEAVVATLREGLAEVAIFVEGPDTSGLEVRPFRQDDLVVVTHRTHRLATSRTPVHFAELLGEDWISFSAGAAILAQQQQAAYAADQPLRLRTQVRSVDAVCSLVIAGLGIALMPRQTVLLFVRAMQLHWRPLADPWARRQFSVAARGGGMDAGTRDLLDFLARPT